jgi:hypothetical protein
MFDNCNDETPLERFLIFYRKLSRTCQCGFERMTRPAVRIVGWMMLLLEGILLNSLILGIDKIQEYINSLVVNTTLGSKETEL